MFKVDYQNKVSPEKHIHLGLVLSRYQKFCIRYQYQWKSKAKHKNMLIKKHICFINKYLFKIVFQVFSYKSMKKKKKFHPKVFVIFLLPLKNICKLLF